MSLEETNETPQAEETFMNDDDSDGGEQPEIDKSSSEDNSQGDDTSLDSLLGNVSETAKPNDIIELVNGLGITREGLPIEFDNIDKVKEVLSKGFDYTVKMQGIADEKRKQEEEFKTNYQNFESQKKEFETYKSSVDNELLANQAMLETMEHIQSQDPDLYKEILGVFNQKMHGYTSSLNNPAFKELNKKVSSLEEALKKSEEVKTKEGQGNILKEWDTGLEQFQKTSFAKVRSLGIKPDYQKIKEVWSSDASGKLTFEQAFMAVHGSSLQKALDSKTKLEETKRKSSEKFGQSNNGNYDQKSNARDYSDMIQKIAARHI